MWLPGRKPKATPWLRVLTSSTPGSSLRSSPSTMLALTACLVSWSAATTTASTSTARSHGPAARIGASAVDQVVDDDGVDDLQREDREDRAEVEPAEGRQHPPEDAQERLADVAQEAEH